MTYGSQTHTDTSHYTDTNRHHKHSINFFDLMLPRKVTYVFYYLKNIPASFLIMNYQKVQLHTIYHWTQVPKKITSWTSHTDPMFDFSAYCK
jgi:hypothetical protein